MLLSYAYTFNFQVWCILYVYMYVYCMLINFSRKNSDFGPLGVISYEFIFCKLNIALAHLFCILKF